MTLLTGPVRPLMFALAALAGLAVTTGQIAGGVDL